MGEPRIHSSEYNAARTLLGAMPKNRRNAVAKFEGLLYPAMPILATVASLASVTLEKNFFVIAQTNLMIAQTALCWSFSAGLD